MRENGPDKKRHFVRYRLLRMPGGVVGLAEELGGPLQSIARIRHIGRFLEFWVQRYPDRMSLAELDRDEALASVDISACFHVADHVILGDPGCAAMESIPTKPEPWAARRLIMLRHAGKRQLAGYTGGVPSELTCR